MAMGAAAAVVVVLLVLYFSLGGSSAEVPERIVLTRGEFIGRDYAPRGWRRLSAETGRR